jgi:hypothetical protein
MEQLDPADRDAFEEVLSGLAMDPFESSQKLSDSVTVRDDGQFLVTYVVRDSRVLILKVQLRP